MTKNDKRGYQTDKGTKGHSCEDGVYNTMFEIYVIFLRVIYHDLRAPM